MPLADSQGTGPRRPRRTIYSMRRRKNRPSVADATALLHSCARALSWSHPACSNMGHEEVRMRDLITMILRIIWATVMLLVGGRFLALLAGANPDSELIHKLYSWSDFWVNPFFGMFHLANKSVDGDTFEPASLLAFAVYLVAGMLVTALLRGHRLTRFLHV